MLNTLRSTSKKFQKASTITAVVVLALLLWIGMPLHAKAEQTALEGAGTSDYPYLISSYEDLETVRAQVAGGDSFEGQYLQMTADVDLPEDWSGIGALQEGASSADSGKNINPFSGTFDGGGHIVTSASGGYALFGYVREATIRDLSIAGENIRGCGLIRHYVSDRGATGTATPKTATVENIIIRSGTSIQGSGIVSGNASAHNTVDITGCIAEEGVVLGSGKNQSWVGSFGGNFNGQITNCRSAATVYGVNYVGGIIGARGNSMSGTSVSGCVFTGQVSASGQYAGGIAGGSYGGVGWGINTAPNAPMLSVTNCLSAGSVNAVDTVGGIVGYETSLQVWENGTGHVENNLFVGNVSATEGSCIGGITGAFRGMDRYNIVSGNYYAENCGANRGIGGAEYVDTSCETHETQYGVHYFDTSKEIPTFEGVNDAYTGNLRADHNRSDDPLGADAETLAKSVTAEQLRDGTVTAWLNSAEGSPGNWTQGEETPMQQGVVFPVRLAINDGYQTDYFINDELNRSDLSFTLIYSDGTTETISGDNENLVITGFDSSKRTVLTLTATYGAVRTSFTVRILQPDTGEKNTVYFTLLGDRLHGPDADCGVHTRAAGNLQEWIPQSEYEVSINATAGDLIRLALAENHLELKGNENTQYDSMYISGVQIPPALLDDPAQTIYLKEKDNGPNAGWMYAVNGKEPGIGVDRCFLEDGDELILFYSDDYTKEESAQPYQEEENRIQAQIVIDLINALPAAGKITLADKDAVQTARAKYDALTDAQKALVDSGVLKHLTDAELAIKNLENPTDPTKPAKKPVKIVKGKTYTVSKYRYRVTKVAGAKAGTVRLVKAKNVKNVSVPKTIKLADKKTYKVTAVGAKSFTGKKIRTITIGANVSKLYAKAFAGSKARTIILKTKRLKKSSVKGSLKGSKIKTIRVKVGTKAQNKKYVKKYKKIFTKKNVGRKAKVQ
jgi:hypothetical protein